VKVTAKTDAKMEERRKMWLLGRLMKEGGGVEATIE